MIDMGKSGRATRVFCTAAMAFSLAGMGSAALTTSAEARPSTKSYTCQGVRGLIAQRGAVVLNTKNRFVYKRFVNSRFYCVREEVIDYESVPTRSGSCRLKYCRDYLSGARFRVGR